MIICGDRIVRLAPGTIQVVPVFRHTRKIRQIVRPSAHMDPLGANGAHIPAAIFPRHTLHIVNVVVGRFVDGFDAKVVQFLGVVEETIFGTEYEIV